MNNLLDIIPPEVPPDIQPERNLVDSVQLVPPLLTDELRRTLPPLYATETDADPIVQVKFFTPDAQWTWGAIEFDGDDTFFGFVKGLEDEMGYFSLSELQEIRGHLGLPVERDLSFEPTRLSAIRE
jgi:Protein of unknown function (DUF2958)